MADTKRDSLKPIEGKARALRQRLDVKGELILALLPTLTVLLLLFLLEALTEQRLLFTSLASSAFLIYLDPQHGMNTVRTLVIAHLLAAFVGLGLYLLLGPAYWAAGVAMVVVIGAMVLLDVVHPPAISTTLSFAMRNGAASNLELFLLALVITTVLVLLERSALWLLARMTAEGGEDDEPAVE